MINQVQDFANDPLRGHLNQADGELAPLNGVQGVECSNHFAPTKINNLRHLIFGSGKENRKWQK